MAVRRMRPQDLKISNLSSLIGSSSSYSKIPSNSLTGVRSEVLGAVAEAVEEEAGSSVGGIVKRPLPLLPDRPRHQEMILPEEELPHHEASVLG